jgi:opine dehydrogenase
MADLSKLDELLVQREVLEYVSGECSFGCYPVRRKNLPLRDHAIRAGGDISLRFEERTYDCGDAAKNTAKVVKTLKRLFPQIVAGSSVLQTSLECANVSVHTVPALLNVGWWEKTRGDLSFWGDLISLGVGRVMDAQEKDKIAVAKALGVDIIPGPEVEKRIYGHMGARGDKFEGFYWMESHKGWRPCVEICDPMFILQEDIPYGLVPLSSLGKMLGVPTPTIDALIHIASLVCKIDYQKTGLTVEKLGLAGMTAKQIVNYVTTGKK